MTKAGVGFIVGGLGIYFVASETQIGWFFLFDALIWSLVLLSALFPSWNIRPLSIERLVWHSRPSGWRQELAGPTEGETVEVRIKVSNRGRLARHLIKLVENLPLEAPESRPRTFLIPWIKGQGQVVFSYTAACYRRGRYNMAAAILETAAPLGLFVRRRRFDLPLKLTVYPAYYEMEGTPLASESWAEQGPSARSSAASEIYSSRDYQYGDPMRHIHWRNTARRGQLVVKEFEEAKEGSVAVAFDAQQDWGTRKETTLEYSIRIAASLARLCGDSGKSISLLAGPAQLLRADWKDAMDYLAGLEVGESPSLAEQIAATDAQQPLVVVAHSRQLELIPSLRHLADAGRRVAVVLLEGFGSEVAPDEFVSQLGANNATLIRCPQGHLKEAIDTLSRAWLLDGRRPS
ncbi:MAG: DUF58 domain-containing protein [Chloroflexi bacterium]|nr:DUF58 domain-containing protein [Chloroflexota bacterium]